MAVSIWEGNKAQALIDAIQQGDKVDKQQGIGNAGKSLIVGSDGYVTTAYAALSDVAIDALMNCFAHVTWIDEYGQQYMDVLDSALREGHYASDSKYTLRNGGKLKIGLLSTNENGIVIDQTDNRYIVFGLSGGTYPYLDKYSGEQMDIYPIPIPNGAKSVMISVTPSSMFYNLSTRLYDAENHKYSGYIQSVSTSQGIAFLNLRGEEYLTCFLAKDANRTAFDDTDIPSEVNVVFLDVEIFKESDWSLNLTNGVGIADGSTTTVDGHTSYDASTTLFVTAGTTNHGFKSYGDSGDSENIYPIPIPSGAKSVSVTVTPSTLRPQISTRNYDKENQWYSTAIESSERVEGHTAMNITEDAEYIVVGIRSAVGSSSVHKSDITSISIEFSSQSLEV